MLEKIGETLEHLDVFKLSEIVAVDEDGIIYKIDRDELCDSIYCVVDFENQETINDVKNHIVNPYKLIVDEHRVDIVNNKIDGAHFEYIDNEDLDHVLIKFKDNEIKLFDDGQVEINVNNKKFEKHIQAIDRAYHYDVDFYESFDSLRF